MCKHIAKKNTEHLCYKCLKEKENTRKINIYPLGYDSFFDNWGTSIQLCADCLKDTNSQWWEFQKICTDFDYGFYQYQYEKEIQKYLYELPIEGQELVFNHNAYGSFADYPMEAQDWIDYKLGILSHEKCLYYGLISPTMTEQFKEKFPTCQYPINVKYEDHIISKCPFGSSGEKDATIISSTHCGNCWNCKNYKKRITPIKTINNDEEYSLYKIKCHYELNKSKIEELFS